jgi:hypothetical protein
MARPRKVKGPLTLEEWLRIILRKKRPEDRMKIFREWCRFILRVRFNREPTDPEIQEEFKLIRERKFEDPNYTWSLGDSLKEFVPVFHKENSRKKAQSAAAIRWSKQNREKCAMKNAKIL